MFNINKRNRQRRNAEQSVIRLKAEVNSLLIGRQNSRKAIKELNYEVHGDLHFPLTMFPKPGLKNEVRLLREEQATNRDNITLLTECLGVEFIDLEAKRIVQKRKN